MPERSRRRRSTLLPLLAEAALAEGDVDRAREAADAALLALGRDLGRETVVAARRAGGGACRRWPRGDDAAFAHLEVAVAGFARLGMPHEEGRARLELAAGARAARDRAGG